MTERFIRCLIPAIFSKTFLIEYEIIGGCCKKNIIKTWKLKLVPLQFPANVWKVGEQVKMKISNIEITQCQHCGGKDLRYEAKGFLENQEPIHHIMCGICGSIIHSWIVNPRKYSKKVPEDAI